MPAERVVRKLDVEDFWYYQTDQEKAGVQPARLDQTLQFLRDGYSLTASQSTAELASDQGYLSDSTILSAPGADYNIVHSKWSISYWITDPIALFERLWDGTERGWSAVDGLLRRVLADSIILTSANRDIDWIIWENRHQFSADVESMMQARLAELDIGLEAKLDDIGRVTPRQVKDAFDQATSAHSVAEQLKTIAKTEESNIIGEARAQASIIKGEAQAYSTKLVEAAKADARYLEEVLDKIEATSREKFSESEPDYQAKRRQAFEELLAITVDQLYQELLRDVISKAEEVIVLPKNGGKPVELRVQLSRDATLGPAGAKENN